MFEFESNSCSIKLARFIIAIKVLLLVAKIRNTPRVQMLGKSGEDVCDAVHEFLVKLASGKGPKTQHVDEFDAFFLLVLKACEFYCTTTVVKPGAGCAMFSKNAHTITTLYGKQACLHIYAEVLAKFENEKAPNPTVHDLKPFKTFGWLLSEQQRDRVTRMNQTATSDEGAAHSKALEDAAGDCTALVVASSSTAKASASSADDPIAVGPVTKKARVKDAKATAARDRMLKFTYQGPVTG